MQTIQGTETHTTEPKYGEWCVWKLTRFWFTESQFSQTSM